MLHSGQLAGLGILFLRKDSVPHPRFGPTFIMGSGQPRLARFRRAHAPFMLLFPYIRVPNVRRLRQTQPADWRT
jgi:hypothetical protein